MYNYRKCFVLFYTHTYIYDNTHVRLHKCMNVNMYICTCICTYICVCMQESAYKSSLEYSLLPSLCLNLLPSRTVYRQAGNFSFLCQAKKLVFSSYSSPGGCTLPASRHAVTSTDLPTKHIRHVSTMGILCSIQLTVVSTRFALCIYVH